MESNTKQTLLVTVVGVTLFVALLRFSDVLAFAAGLVDLVLPILAGGILALFLHVPMAGLEKRLKQLFRNAKKQPSDKSIHLLSFFLTLLGVLLVLVLALTLLIPELVQSFHSLYLQIEANIPGWVSYLNAQDADMGWLLHWLEGINWEQLLHKAADSIDKVARAYRFAADYHRDQRRRSGEPYINHPVEVALILAKDLRMDEDTICAALLHDTVEDTSASLDQLKGLLGAA